MPYLNIFKSDKFVRVLSYIGFSLAMLYAVCMFIIPFVLGGCDWPYVQNVWHRWQSLNASMLALVSSIIALNISLLKAENQRERNFLASKAFLPAALSELTAYFEESALLLKQGWASETGSKPGIKLPPPPKEYKSVFADCIRHATPDVGDYLSQILVWLQVHDSRLERLCISRPRKRTIQIATK